MHFALKPETYYNIHLTALTSILNCTGWTGPSLVRLNHTNYPEETPASFQITDTEESWIGSLMPIGALIGGKHLNLKMKQNAN